ncbi:hypothetical protein DY000_02024419 [Brassica cretica]|uniref:Uncharacterized protein n=1 Tax=Brassica cretica TaxID=69181 RepID=A0ABQ7EMH3_BRACR|nr:hypothetical protein DY000_02024419 [Brassica cretica]
MKTLLTRQSAFSRNQLWSLLFEAEMLFKIPMTRGDPKSTCEAQRLFGMRHPNSTCEEAERLFKNPITPANANFDLKGNVNSAVETCGESYHSFNARACAWV